tara:strand:+ start:213787 stop:214650 length:864 start_codon:yes stop_codon:yes gene_type:complete
MTKTFFVGIGAAKGGTSWLADYLGQHPEVAFSPIKELHYFDAMYCQEHSAFWNNRWAKIRAKFTKKYQAAPDDKLKQKMRCLDLRLAMVENPTVYRQYFDELISDHHKAFGEITPAYSLLPESGFKAIIELYPEAKFIFIMRDPAMRYLSQIQFSQTIREIQGKDKALDFDPNSKAIEFLENTSYTARSDYKRTIESLLRVTTPDNLCALFYENIFSDVSTRELQKLCNFLKISFQSPNISRKVNPSNSMEFEPEVIRRVSDYFSEIYEFVFTYYGNEVPETWHRPP